MDAIFNPVRKVNYNIKRTRVGQVTDYERLELEVWTDGTIKPVEAVRQAADHLVNHFFLFTSLDRAAEAGTERPSLSVSPEIYQTPIERLELSPRTLNCLKRAHITKVGEVLEMSDDDLTKIRNFGEKSLQELKEKLAARGVTAQTDGPQGGLPAAGVANLEPTPLAAIGDLSPTDIEKLMGDDDVAYAAATGNGEWPKLEADGADEDDNDAEDEEES